jgi:hypothetical protein
MVHTVHLVVHYILLSILSLHAQYLRFTFFYTYIFSANSLLLRILTAHFVRLLAPQVGHHFYKHLLYLPLRCAPLITDLLSETTLVGRHLLVLYLYPILSGAVAHLHLLS